MNRPPFLRSILRPAGIRGSLALLLSLWLPLLAGRGRVAAAPPENDGQVAARETALELAGAFTNDGYKIRDGHWTGLLQPHATQVVKVNLYAGNQYYFALGSTEKAKKVAVTVYDETGHQVGDEQFFQEKSRAAAGVSPTASGLHYVSIELLEGDPADFCLLYSYK